MKSIALALLIAASAPSLRADDYPYSYSYGVWNFTVYGLTNTPGRYFGSEYVPAGSVDLLPGGYNYRFAFLGELDLPNVDLHGINGLGIWLRGSNLSGSNFAGANLEGADFGSDGITPGADLTNAYMADAYLHIADMTGTILSNTYLRFADLTGAWLTAANLYKVDFTGANLSGARVPFADWNDFLSSNNYGLDTYLYDPNQIFFTGRSASTVYDRSLRPDLQETPEPSTYGLIGLGALGVAFAARRRKLKTA